MKNVLIPTDLRECTTNTINYALQFGLKTHTKLFFLHAGAQDPEAEKVLTGNLVTTALRKLKAENEIPEIEYLVTVTPFSNKLMTELVKTHDIDLVIMGTSKAEGLKATFFGTLISTLIDEVNCQVLAVPHGYSGDGIERIGYSSELYDLHKRLKEIIPLAAIFDAWVEIFHVYPVFPQTVDVEKFDIKQELALLRRENNYEKINLHFIHTALDNQVVTGINEFCTIYKPDLLVMCHKHRDIFDKLTLDIGTTFSVLDSVAVPLLTIKEVRE